MTSQLVLVDGEGQGGVGDVDSHVGPALASLVPGGHLAVVVGQVGALIGLGQVKAHLVLSVAQDSVPQLVARGGVNAEPAQVDGAEDIEGVEVCGKRDEPLEFVELSFGDLSTY